MPAKPTEYEFTIGFQMLTGLPEDGLYGIAWKKGAEEGRCEPQQTCGKELALGYQSVVSETVGNPDAAKNLLEVFVYQYGTGGGRQTIGMLYMDLSMHVPKTPARNGVKQAACLQLSNCAHPLVRLSLTVQCNELKDGRGASGSAQAGGQLTKEALSQQVKELRDELTRLTRENKRLKKEDEYTYSNQPVRTSVKALEEKIAALTEEVSGLKQAAEAAKAQHAAALEEQTMGFQEERVALKGAFEAKELTYIQEISELKTALDRQGRGHEDALAALRGEMASSFQSTVETNRLKGISQNTELEALHEELTSSRKEVATLRRQVKRHEENQDSMQRMSDETSKTKHELQLLCNALESQKACLSQRVEQLESDQRDMVAQTRDEREATEEAKVMLGELMARVRECQKTEEEMQAMLAFSDEEKTTAQAEQRRLAALVQRMEADLRTARNEEKALSHGRVEDLVQELETQKLKVKEVSADAEQKLGHMKEERDQAVQAAATQAETIVQKKRRISDLKRILGLHLKLREAQSIASTDGALPELMGGGGFLDAVMP